MKKLAILFITVVAFNACNQTTTVKPTTSANETLVKNYFDYFNAHNWTKMAAMYADTSDFKDPSLGQGIVKQSRQQIIEKYSQLSFVFNNLHDEVIQTYPSDNNHIIVEFVSTGMGPDSTTFELPICTIFTIENGLITKDYTYYNNLVDHEKSEEKK
ncbi:MAG: nuclear transport factor 2 family protein [Bacteroidia bacterium]|nr:nuclear transport factor 2 family protein [Bacteroidia bacterium]